MTYGVVACLGCRLVGRLRKHGPMFAEEDEPCPFCHGCRVCGVKVLARGRCNADYHFQRRRGRDRTDEEITRAQRLRFTNFLAVGR